MKTRTLTIKDQYRNEVEKVIYDRDTLLIQKIEVWTESFQGFRPISPKDYRNESPYYWDLLEKQVADHHYESLVGDADRREKAIMKRIGVA